MKEAVSSSSTEAELGECSVGHIIEPQHEEVEEEFVEEEFVEEEFVVRKDDRISCPDLSNKVSIIDKCIWVKIALRKGRSSSTVIIAVIFNLRLACKRWCYTNRWLYRMRLCNKGKKISMEQIY